MTNKRVIIVLSVLGLIAILLLVSSLVFKIKTIDVVFATEQTTIEQSEVVENSQIKMGGSIFFVNKNKAKQNIELNVPYAKVDSIESKFPNKIVINVSVREEEFLVKYETESELSYLVCDNELQILREVTSTEGLELTKLNYVSTQNNPALIAMDEGESWLKFKEIILYFESYGFNKAKVNKYFTEVGFEGDDAVIKTCYNSTITIKNIATDTKGKVATALSIFLTGGEGGSEYKTDLVVTQDLTK